MIPGLFDLILCNVFESVSHVSSGPDDVVAGRITSGAVIMDGPEMLFVLIHAVESIHHLGK